MTRGKPCATCGHPKTHHKAEGCIHTRQVMGRTFMGNRLITMWCVCPGYQEVVR